MIDKNWRAFLSGKEIIFVKAIIQETFEAFFNFAKENNLFQGDPYQVKVFEIGLSSRDIQGIQPLYSQSFNFQYIHSRSGKVEAIQTSVVKLKDSLRKVIGNREYNERLQVGEPIISTLKKYTDFFVAARNLGFHRNTESHEKLPIEETGFALNVASDVMTIIELTPIIIRDQDALAGVRKILKNLLNDILIKEDPALNAFTDDETEFKEGITDLNLSTVTIDSLETKYNDIESKLDVISELIEDNKIATFTIAEIMRELQPSISSSDQIEKIREGIQLNQENIERILEQQQLEIEDEKIQQSADLNLEKEKVLKTLNVDDVLASPFNPTKTIKLAMEIKEDVDLKKSKSSSELEIISDIGSSRAVSLTPQQAINEMQKLQKKIKQEFRCKNWQNIAQGPFREKILEDKILSKQEFLENSLIQQRYELHKDIMDTQINSHLGNEFFNILKSVMH